MKCECGGEYVRQESTKGEWFKCNKCKKKKDADSPITALEQAQLNYLREFTKMMENYHKLYDYIKPLIETNKEMMDIADNINLHLVVLPISHMVINTAHMVNIETMKTLTMVSLPPLKIECPTCKKTVWDVSDIKDFLDPEGKIYKRDKHGNKN